MYRRGNRVNSKELKAGFGDRDKIEESGGSEITKRRVEVKGGEKGREVRGGGGAMVEEI